MAVQAFTGPAQAGLFLLAVMLAACETGVDTQTDAETVAPPAHGALALRAVQRCTHCGWIESKRQIASSIADPQSIGVYEYTLRMTDGSSRVFRETLPASWRVGERLALIDGQGAAVD